jgi:hypothetical protein
VEPEIFRTLNAWVEPLVIAGFGAPGFSPTGMIVLETLGARSGRPSRVPLFATILAECVLVSTVRGARSGWARNLRVRPHVRYWLAGREHRGRARVFAPGTPPPDTDDLPPLARIAASVFLPPATLFGWTFAVISPA